MKKKIILLILIWSMSGVLSAQGYYNSKLMTRELKKIESMLERKAQKFMRSIGADEELRLVHKIRFNYDEPFVREDFLNGRFLYKLQPFYTTDFGYVKHHLLLGYSCLYDKEWKKVVYYLDGDVYESDYPDKEQGKKYRRLFKEHTPKFMFSIERVLFGLSFMIDENDVIYAIIEKRGQPTEIVGMKEFVENYWDYLNGGWLNYL